MAIELIPIREYARRRGCSDTSVHKAIKSGKIVKGLVKKAGKPFINPAVADAEWAQNHNPAQERTTRAGKPLMSEADQVPESSGAGAANRQAENTLAAAKRAQAVFKAKLAELEFKEKSGALVDKQEVYKALFAAGQEVKQAIMIIPDRVVDDMLACRSRNEAHQLLSDALADALETVADLDKRDITKRQ